MHLRQVLLARPTAAAPAGLRAAAARSSESRDATMRAGTAREHDVPVPPRAASAVASRCRPAPKCGAALAAHREEARPLLRWHAGGHTTRKHSTRASTAARTSRPCNGSTSSLAPGLYFRLAATECETSSQLQGSTRPLPRHRASERYDTPSTSRFRCHCASS